MNRWYRKALDVAATSTYDRINIGAVIVKGNWLVSTGVNQTKSHPMQARYNRHRDFECADHLHAEISALIRSGREDLEGADIYVARRDRNGNLANCKPCAACAKAIEDAGISNVFYINDNGELEVYGV